MVFQDRYENQNVNQRIMTIDSAHSSMYRTSDFILLIILLSGGLIEYLFIWELSLQVAVYIRIIIGIAIITLGIFLIGKSNSTLKKERQPSEPGKATTQIIQSGIYSKTRNPTYLGCSILLLGLGIVFNFFAWIVGAFLSLILMHFLLVIPEEKYLTSKFPQEFDSYKKKVRRWI